MIEPYRCGDALLADIASAGTDPETCHLWWLGQSGFLLQWNGHRLLFDPYLSDTLTEKYRGTARPHERISRLVIQPERLTGIGLATSTHHHTDHLDAATLGPLLDANPGARLIVPRAALAVARERLPRHHDALDPLDAGDELRTGPWQVIALPAAHETIERDADGHTRCLGYAVRVGPFAVYHAGDTVRYDGQAERLRALDVDVALLPINGRDPARGVPGNLTGEEAAALAADAGVRLAIPCHYDLFAFNTASPEPFARRAAELGQAVRVPRLGERVEVRAAARR